MSMALAIVTVLAAWFATTASVLWLGWRRESDHPAILLALTVVAALGFAAMLAAGDLPPDTGAYVTFGGVLAAWSWVEFAFLAGVVTGTRREPCPADATGGLRFRLAFRTVNLHEYALVTLLAGAGLVSLATGRPDAILFMGTLWVMRVSAKLTLFDGAPRFSSDLLPQRLAHMTTYFRADRIGPVFWLSTAATTTVLVAGAIVLAAGLVPRDHHVAACLAWTLLALAAVEHWLMVLPVHDSKLWAWALPRVAPGETIR